MPAIVIMFAGAVARGYHRSQEWNTRSGSGYGQAGRPRQTARPGREGPEEYLWYFARHARDVAPQGMKPPGA